MKAISLWQPWATAIAVGVKKIETRHWYTKYRGPLAIHAAKHWDRAQQEFANVEFTLGRIPSPIPRGAIIATCKLVNVHPAWQWKEEGNVGPIEAIYGNYGPGRYAWCLEDVVALPVPIPFKGMQGFFNVPDEILNVPMTEAANGERKTS